MNAPVVNGTDPLATDQGAGGIAETYLASEVDPIRSDAPHPGASFLAAFRRFWVKYSTLRGRASRAEFWWVALFVNAPFILLGDIVPGRVLWLWAAATIVPMVAVTVRRLHDTTRSGANALWILLPVIGWVVLLVQVAAEPSQRD